MPWTPESMLTEDEYDRLPDEDKTLHDLVVAQGKGDWKTADRLMTLIDFPAEALMAIKRVKGADRIRELGVRTATAEAKYGKDWLNH